METILYRNFFTESRSPWSTTPYVETATAEKRNVLHPRLCNYSILTPWSTVLLEKLTGFQLVKKFPAFYGTRLFITALKSARHLSLSWARSIQSKPPHPTSWRSILLLSSHLRLCLPNGLFPSGFPTKTWCTPLPSSIRATCHAHLIHLDLITRIIFGEQHRSLSSSLCSFLHSHVTSSLLDPSIPLSTLFSDTLSLRSSLTVSDQVAHPKKNMQRGMGLYLRVEKEERVVIISNCRQNTQRPYIIPILFKIFQTFSTIFLMTSDRRANT